MIDTAKLRELEACTSIGAWGPLSVEELAWLIAAARERDQIREALQKTVELASELRAECDTLETALESQRQATEEAMRRAEKARRELADWKWRLAWLDDRLDVREGRRGVEFALRWEALCDPEVEYSAADAIAKGMASEADLKADDDGREDEGV